MYNRGLQIVMFKEIRQIIWNIYFSYYRLLGKAIKKNILFDMSANSKVLFFDIFPLNWENLDIKTMIRRQFATDLYFFSKHLFWSLHKNKGRLKMCANLGLRMWVVFVELIQHYYLHIMKPINGYNYHIFVKKLTHLFNLTDIFS